MTGTTDETQTLGRREFLFGAGAAGLAGLALPILPSLGRAASPDFPKRLVVFFSGNGTIAPNWIPESSNGRITQLSEILSPLEPHLDDLAVLEGLDIDCGRHEYQPKGGFHGHERGLGGILTGQPLQLGNFVEDSGYPDGQSVDQFIADRMQQGANPPDIHSLQVGLCSNVYSDRNRCTMSYAGPDSPKFHQRNGKKLFDYIFGGGASTPEVYERIRKRKRSILDFLRNDLKRVEKKLSSRDRQRLERHHQTFREIESRLQNPPPACEGTEPQIDRWSDEANMDDISRVQIRQTVQALACDRTRVATMQFGRGLGGLSLKFVGDDDHWHSLSHEGDGNETAQRKLTEANKYIASRFKLLLDEMKAIPEGDGTLLDNSVVLWVNELGKGNTHEYDDVPIVMAGDLQGAFNTGGRHFRFDGRSHNDLLTTLCRGFGHSDVSEFGLSQLNSGPIDRLLA